MSTHIVEDEQKDYYPICGIYNKTPEKGLAPGLYLGLMHGRRPANERLSGWGLDGPIIGPLKYVHTTYGSDLHLAMENGTELESLEINGGLLEFNGIYCGDWTVFFVSAAQPRASESTRRRGTKHRHPRSRSTRRALAGIPSRRRLPPAGENLLLTSMDEQAMEEDLDEPG